MFHAWLMGKASPNWNFVIRHGWPETRIALFSRSSVSLNYASALLLCQPIVTLSYFWHLSCAERIGPCDALSTCVPHMDIWLYMVVSYGQKFILCVIPMVSCDILVSSNLYFSFKSGSWTLLCHYSIIIIIKTLVMTEFHRTFSIIKR